jgi:chromosome segregation ATPase
MSHQLNWLFEKSKDLEKEMDEWQAKAETLVVSRDKARQETLEAMQQIEDLRQEIAKGEEVYNNSQVTNAELHLTVDALAAAFVGLEIARAVQENEATELQSSSEAVRTDQANKIRGLEETIAAAERREQEAAVRIEALMKRAEEAEARAETAVANFRSSEAFEKEKLDFSITAFESGIKITQERVAAKYPDLDWSFLLEVEESEDEAAAPDLGDVPPPAEL